MESFPQSVKEMLYQTVIGDRPIGLMELDLDYRLQSQQGSLQSFGIEELDRQIPVDEQVDFLTGLLNPDYFPLELPFLETPAGIVIDVHIFSNQDRIWILLIGAADRSIRQQSVQQKVNDLSLNQKRQSRILNQYLGEEVARRLQDGIDGIDSNGERRKLTMMFADIRGFTTFSEKSRPEEVFETLNIYLRAMIPSVIEADGVIDKIIGDEIMAIFGMLPGHGDGANSALLAAVNMLRAVKELNRVRSMKKQTLLQVGIGIATGSVSLGVIGSRDRKSITVIGNHVNLAARLQGLADADQLYLDHDTFSSITHLKPQFSRELVELKGYSEPVDVYSLKLDRIRGSELGLLPKGVRP